MKRCHELYCLHFCMILLITLVGLNYVQGEPGDSLVVSNQHLTNSINRLHPDDVVRLFPRLVEACPDIAFTVPCIPPVGAWDHNRLSSQYGLRLHPIQGRYKHHEGIDIAGPHQYVRSAASGRVIRAGYAKGLGLHVVIDHGNSYQTIYGHLALILCQINQRLAIGERIGILGETGLATGLHLHYAIKKGGRYVNPAPYLTIGLKLIAQYQANAPLGK